MRIACMDEAGVANPAQEPYLVVAAAMIEPDRRYGPLTAHLSDLATEFMSSDLLDEVRAVGNPFVFQAKHVWHGEGYFPREDKINWHMARRMRLFGALSKIPERFSLNVMCAAVDRRKFHEDHQDMPAKQREGMLHAFAFFNVMRRVDRWMIEHAPTEYVFLHAESRPEVERYIEIVHSMYTDRSLDEKTPKGAFSTTHIAEPVAFVKKHRSATLQVADHCAFIIKRKLQGCKHVGKYYENIRPMIWDKPTEASAIYDRAPRYLLD